MANPIIGMGGYVMKKLAVVLVEDRYFPDTIQICKDHMKFLPEDTELIFYTGPEHFKRYRKELSSVNFKYELREYDRKVPIPLSIKYNDIIAAVSKDTRLKALLNFCLFQTTEEFWKGLFDYERILHIHRDTKILRKGIEEYLEYDYIGAPCYNFIGDNTIQNGALCIRNPRTMEYICRMHGWKTDLYEMMAAGQYSSASFFAEDIFFCVRMIKYRIGNLAPLNVAKKFACEVKFELGTFGYHAISRYLTKEEVYKINNQYNKV